MQQDFVDVGLPCYQHYQLVFRPLCNPEEARALLRVSACQTSNEVSVLGQRHTIGALLYTYSCGLLLIADRYYASAVTWHCTRHDEIDNGAVTCIMQLQMAAVCDSMPSMAYAMILMYMAGNGANVNGANSNA